MGVAELSYLLSQGFFCGAIPNLFTGLRGSRLNIAEQAFWPIATVEVYVASYQYPCDLPARVKINGRIFGISWIKAFVKI
jgi:hypothetical protein